MAQYFNFLYNDLITGEDFIVQIKGDEQDFEELEKKADAIAWSSFQEPVSLGFIEEEAARQLGCDIY